MLKGSTTSASTSLAPTAAHLVRHIVLVDPYPISSMRTSFPCSSGVLCSTVLIAVVTFGMNTTSCGLLCIVLAIERMAATKKGNSSLHSSVVLFVLAACLVGVSVWREAPVHEPKGLELTVLLPTANLLQNAAHSCPKRPMIHKSEFVKVQAEERS